MHGRGGGGDRSGRRCESFLSFLSLLLTSVDDGSQFYGGWKTAEHEGKMKGGAGTWGW